MQERYRGIPHLNVLMATSEMWCCSGSGSRVAELSVLCIAMCVAALEAARAVQTGRLMHMIVSTSLRLALSSKCLCDF